MAATKIIVNHNGSIRVEGDFLKAAASAWQAGRR